MTLDINRAHDVDHGLLVNDPNSGNNVPGPFYTGGPVSPVGLNLPESTFYVQNTATGIVVWEKFGNGTNDWRVYPASKVSFDPTSLLNFEPTDTDVQAALARLGNISLSELAEIEGFNSNALETTTSNGWVSKSGFPWASQVKTAGLFSLRWYMEVGQTKATRSFGFRVLWRQNGGAWSVLAEITGATVSKDNGSFMQSGFKEVELLADSAIEIDIQHGQTIDGFASTMENVTVEVRRIGDLP